MGRRERGVGRVASTSLVLALILISAPRERPGIIAPPGQNVTPETALWLLKRARARLSGRPVTDPLSQEVTPAEATEARQTTLLVTPFNRGCAICPRSAAGTGDNLAGALDAAVRRIPASIVAGHNLRGAGPQAEPDRIQIDILDGSPEPLVNSGGVGVSAADIIDPGSEGLLVETREEAFFLSPAELIYRSLLGENPATQSADEFLSRAMELFNMPREAWKGPYVKLSRFRVQTFVEDATCNRPLRVVRGYVPVAEADRDRLLSAARMGGDYLIRMQKPEGSFVYSYTAAGDRASSRSYNILRHAGTAFSLYELYGTTRDIRYLEAARKAVRFLGTRFRPARQRRAFYVLDNDGKAKLGANGLALLVLVSQMELDPLMSDHDSAAKLANLILLLQHRDGSFQSYYPVHGNETTESVSLYYPGEAILGLVRLYGVNGDRRLLRAARAGADYLIGSQRKLPELPPDAWLMQALEALYRIGKESRYAEHAILLAETMFRYQYGESDPAGYAGAFRPGIPRATPAASRAEGLLAAYRLARSINDWRATRIATALQGALRFQLSQQFTVDNSYFLPQPQRAIGGFRASITSTRIRIDFVQHNVCALLGFAQTLN